MIRKKIGGIFSIVLLLGIIAYVVFYHSDDMAELFIDDVVRELQAQTDQDVLSIHQAEYYCEKAINKADDIVYRCGYFVVYQSKNTNQYQMVGVRVIHEGHAESGTSVLSFETYAQYETLKDVLGKYKMDMEKKSFGPGTWQVVSSGATITKMMNQALESLN